MIKINLKQEIKKQIQILEDLIDSQKPEEEIIEQKKKLDKLLEKYVEDL